MNKKLLNRQKPIEPMNDKAKNYLLPGLCSSKIGDELHFPEILENMSEKFYTMQSLKEDYLRLIKKIKIMDDIIEDLKSHLDNGNQVG